MKPSKSTTLPKKQAQKKQTLMEHEIEAVLKDIRPLLALHKGDIDFVGFDEPSGVVRVRLKGTCTHCPLSELTLKGGVEEMLKQRLHGINRVEAVSF